MHMSAVEIDAGYWDRQLPPDVLAKLAANGERFGNRLRAIVNGDEPEPDDLLPVVRLFMAGTAYEVLLICSAIRDANRLDGLLNDGSGWESRRMSLSRLKAMRGPLGLPLERDRTFKPKGPVSAYLPQPDAHDE